MVMRWGEMMRILSRMDKEWNPMVVEGEPNGEVICTTPVDAQETA